VQRELTVVCPWQRWTLLHCWQLQMFHNVTLYVHCLSFALCCWFEKGKIPAHAMKGTWGSICYSSNHSLPWHENTSSVTTKPVLKSSPIIINHNHHLHFCKRVWKPTHRNCYFSIQPLQLECKVKEIRKRTILKSMWTEAIFKIVKGPNIGL
jgi:hypothetical protein